MKRLSLGIFRSLNGLYDEAQLVNYRRKGLNWILAANMCGSLCGAICMSGTAAMVGLANLFGAGDFEFGLLASIPQIAAMLQIPFSMLVNRTHKRKRYMLTWGLASRFMWIMMGFLPLLFPDTSSKLPIVFMLLFLAISSTGNSLINVCWFPWFSDIAPLNIRGRWLSFRDTFNSVGSLLFGLLVAYLLDVLPIGSKFTIIFLIGGTLGVCDMLCFSSVKDEWQTSRPQISVFKTFRSVLTNKPFMWFTAMWTVWCFTANMSGAYITPYAMNSMGLTFMQITIFGTVTVSLATVVFVTRWGRVLDRFGSRNVMLISCVVASLTPLFYLMSVPGSIWPTFLHNAIGAMFWSGSNLAATNMQLSLSPDAERPSYIAVFSCMTSLAGGALGTMCGSWILGIFESSGYFVGFFDRYKALILLASVLRLVTTLILVPRLPKDRAGSFSAVIKSLFSFRAPQR